MRFTVIQIILSSVLLLLSIATTAGTALMPPSENRLLAVVFCLISVAATSLIFAESVREFKRERE